MTDLVHGSEQWQKYRKRALNDLFWFADVVLGYGELVPITPRAHALMCKFAERKTGVPMLDEAWVRLMLVPRGVGKSTIITQAGAIQTALQHPNCSILIANEKADGAQKFLAEIKSQFATNGFLRALFPDIIPNDPEHDAPKWSESEVTLLRDVSRKEPTFLTTGIGGAITGMHPDLAYVDDMLSDEAMENARAGSFQIIEKTNRWINQLRPLVNDAERWQGIFVVGTPWWEGDSYTHVEASFAYGQEPQKVTLAVQLDDGSAKVECYRKGDIAVFRRPILEHGTSFFPERWPDEKLAKMRVADPLLYAANMMLDPTAPEVVVFKETWRRYYEWDDADRVHYMDQAQKHRYVPISDLDCIMSIDPAFTEGGTTSARQALMVTGQTAENLHLVLCAQATRKTLDSFVADIVNWCRRARVRKILIERVAQQKAFINQVSKALITATLPVVVTEVTPGGKQKDARIGTLEYYFERGLIYAHRDMQDFWREYDGFPRAKFKDLLDALAYQPEFWSQRPTSANGEDRAREERTRLYQRMGVAPTSRPYQDPRFRADGSKRW